MRQISDSQWGSIQERQDGEFPSPAPGGYIGYIVGYEDVERPTKPGGGSQYLRIEWDFAEGEFKLYNRDTYDRANFWPGFGSFIRSYKDSALPFFKAFKTCLEVSNNGYHFRTDQLDAMRGKKLGIVLGEEEYCSKDGELKTRLYVAQVRSVKAIRDGDFKVPALKKHKGAPPAPAPASQYAPQYAQPQPYAAQPQAYNAPPQQWAELEDDGELPF